MTTVTDGLVRLRLMRPTPAGWAEVTVRRRTPTGVVTCRLYIVHAFHGLLHGHGAPPDGLTHAYVDEDTRTLYLPPAPSLGIDHGPGAPPDGTTTAWLDDSTSVLHVPWGENPRTTLAARRGAPAAETAPYVDPDTGVLYLTQEGAL